MRPILFAAAVALLLAAGCSNEPDAPSARALAGAVELDARRVAAPEESEPDFDIVGPAWEVAQPPASEDGVYTIEVPVPETLPAGVTPEQLSVAAYEPSTTDRASFWILAGSVEYDAGRGVLVAQARGRGVFAAAVPNGYWTVAPSADGAYEIYYSADEADARSLAALLQDELAATRSWVIEEGYDEPVDGLGQPQRVFIRALRGGRALAQPTAFGVVLLVSDRLAATPDAVAAAVTHELFHLSQGQALQDAANAWSLEATAEFATVRRLGVEAAKPQTDRSCANYARSVTDTRGLNEYENWTFFAYLEYRRPGSVREFLDLQSQVDAVAALREVTETPLSELLGEYAGAYRYQQSFPLAEGLPCPALEALAVGTALEVVVPSLAGLVVTLDALPDRELVVTVEVSGSLYAALWQGPDFEVLEADAGGRIDYTIECGAGDRVALVFGAGVEPADLRVSAATGEAC